MQVTEALNDMNDRIRQLENSMSKEDFKNFIVLFTESVNIRLEDLDATSGN